jgi:hypothetical protein
MAWDIKQIGVGATYGLPVAALSKRYVAHIKRESHLVNPEISLKSYRMKNTS